MNSVAKPPFTFPGVDEVEESPQTIVLQPVGCLEAEGSLTLQTAIAQALEQAAISVIVDFLWVDAIGCEGITVLTAALTCATTAGKTLSFQSMDYSTYRALQAEWNRQQENRLGSRSYVFSQELEQFLEKRSRRQAPQEPTDSRNTVAYLQQPLSTTEGMIPRKPVLAKIAKNH